MNASSDQFHRSYVFSRSLRYPYMMRALLMIVLGIVILFISASRDNALQSVSPQWAFFLVLKIIGAVFILIGLGAFVIHAVSALMHETQAVEVDSEGLKLIRFDKNGKTQTQAFKWNDVAGYRVTVKADIGVSNGQPNLPAEGGRLIGADNSGLTILGSMIFGVFTFGLTRSLIPSSRKTVTFVLTTRQKFSFKGFGIPMAELADALPRFLPNKVV